MWILQKYVTEKIIARAQDHLVSSNLLIIHSGQCDICKVLIIPEFSECIGCICLKIILALHGCVM